MYDFLRKNLNDINVELFCGFILMFANLGAPVLIKRIRKFLLKKIIVANL